ncbi:MAG: transposase [Caldilineaceae bacterium]
MIDILALLQCLKPEMSTTMIGQMERIVVSMLAMTGRVTMLGLSRWAGEGGSYRTIQRFYNTTVDWGQIHWLVIKTHLLPSEAQYILAGDEVVVTKAGKATYGLNRFFSSLYGKPVPGVSFFSLALVNVVQRSSHPLRIGQVLRSEAENAAKDNETKPVTKRGRGRPKGSKNRNKADVTLSPYLRFILSLLQAVKQLLGTTLTVSYVVLDGAFGNHAALQMVRRCDYHLISKLAVNSALFFRSTAPYGGRGAPKKYGDKVKYANLPQSYRLKRTTEGDIRTDIYQFTALHKLFAQPLNVVVILKTTLTTNACAHVILFSSDLDQSYDQIIDYYTLRFQIEFNFRDAKQFWGLEDFMNVKQTPLTAAANLAFFMVNLSFILRQRWPSQQPAFSVLDLKAHFRGLKYVSQTLKLLPQTPDPIVIQSISTNLTRLGAINAP